MSKLIKNPSITAEEAMLRASISIPQFAELTGLSTITAYRYAKSGIIESTLIGTRRVIPRSVYSSLIGEDE